VLAQVVGAVARRRVRLVHPPGLEARGRRGNRA
jgi:hypothetical protein